jgi:hypothetical protein
VLYSDGSAGARILGGGFIERAEHSAGIEARLQRLMAVDRARSPSC